jgi:hypothetical protein
MVTSNKHQIQTGHPCLTSLTQAIPNKNTPPTPSPCRGDPPTPSPQPPCPRGRVSGLACQFDGFLHEIPTHSQRDSKVSGVHQGLLGHTRGSLRFQTNTEYHFLGNDKGPKVASLYDEHTKTHIAINHPQALAPSSPMFPNRSFITLGQILGPFRMRFWNYSGIILGRFCADCRSAA